MRTFATRRAWFCCLTLVIPITAAAQAKRVAVYDFDYSAVRGDVVHVYGSEKAVGAQIANRIISKLVNSSNVPFDVIDRNQIDRLLKEQNQKFSDRFDPRDAPKLGKLLNVDAIVTGTIDQISGEVQNNRLGVGPVGLGGVDAVAMVTVSARVISTETAKIFLADQVNNKQKHNLGKGARIGNKGGSEGGTTNAFPAGIAANLALQKAADEIAEKIIAKGDQLPSRTGATSTVKTQQPAPVDSTPAPKEVLSGGEAARSSEAVSLRIGRIDGAKLYITGGENAGLKINDYLEVRRVTGTMKDDRGNAIETDERIDTVVITDISEKFSVAKPARGATTEAKVGDRVKRIKAPAPAKKSASAPAGNAVLPAPVQRRP